MSKWRLAGEPVYGEGVGRKCEIVCHKGASKLLAGEERWGRELRRA